MVNEVIMESYERNSDNDEDIMNILGMEDYDKNIIDMGVDSLGYIKLIVLLEGYYDIEFEDEDIASHKLRSVNDLYEAINNYLADQ